MSVEEKIIFNLKKAFVEETYEVEGNILKAESCTFDIDTYVNGIKELLTNCSIS